MSWPKGRCDECGAEAPAHFGRCSKNSPEARRYLERFDEEVAKNKARDAEREAKVAPYGRNRNGVPNRPNEPTVITVQCSNKRMAEGWAAFIRSQQHILDALPLAIVKVEDWPE